MGGGLLQLSINAGSISNEVFYNPQISFFNYVYKKHTNFAIETNTYEFANKPENITNMHIAGPYNVKLNASSDIDLLKSICFAFKLPNVYSDNKFKFKWVENVGSLIIKNASIHIGNVEIDKITGQWLIVWNELSMPVKDSYNTMTGNIAELTNPRKTETIYRIRNNILSEYDYPASNKKNSDNPSIKERFILVPLPFWFSKNPNLAFPIIKVFTSYDVYLKFEFENIENLYTIYSDIYNMNISPSYYNELNNLNQDSKITIKDFIIDNNFTAHVDVTFIILGVDERNLLISNQKEYLIETVSDNKSEFTAFGDNSTVVIDVKSQLLVKEIIWTLNRADSIKNFNDILNYSYSIPRNNEKSIMKTASIMWNETYTRVAEKDSYYYNNSQPYEYHTSIPRQGIYSYSFSLFPEKWFPSGCYNEGSAQSKLKLTLNNYTPTVLDKLHYDKFKKNYKISDTNNDIIITVYTVKYNKLKFNISGGFGLNYNN
jgi:hypothetical protein